MSKNIVEARLFILGNVESLEEMDYIPVKDFIHLYQSSLWAIICTHCAYL